MYTAIFGGTFNPFHIGHYEMLKALNDDPRIDKIFLMPDGLPPHKTSKFLVDDEIRIEMCRIAANDFKKCELCLIEFEREGKSYTYDTVKLLQERYPENEFAFVCGGDMLVYFDRWWRYKDLMEMLPFFVFRRTDTEDSEFDSCVNKFTAEGMKIFLKNDIISTVSSTKVREDFLNSKELLPKKIYDYLYERGVYFEKV